MHRDFRVEADSEGFVDEDQVAAAFGFVQTTLELFGGAFTVYAIRPEVAPGRFEMRGYGFHYDSFMPSERAYKGQDAEEREPVEVT
jgi:hypothetical protein